jgi:hypothetical protein
MGDASQKDRAMQYIATTKEVGTDPVVKAASKELRLSMIGRVGWTWE